MEGYDLLDALLPNGEGNIVVLRAYLDGSTRDVVHPVNGEMGKWVKANDKSGSGIVYLIEAGDEGYDQLAHLLSYAGKSPDVTDAYQWRRHGITPKTPNSPFHAPDTLAWEWGKYITETALEKKRLMRMSFVHLIQGRLDRYGFLHLADEPLMRFFSRINELGVEQLQEDRDAVSSVPLVDVREVVESSARREPGENLG